MCAKPNNEAEYRMQNLWRMGNNSSPILQRLWTKVHEVLKCCRGRFAVSNAYNIIWFLILTKFSPPVNLLTYIISSLFKLTIILVPLMLSHLLVHLPPHPLRSQIAVFSMPRLISGINFHFHFVNQFHLFMLTSIHPSVLHSPHPSPFTLSVTLNSKLTFLVNLIPQKSLTIDISDWLPRLMGPFTVFTVFLSVISCFWCGRQN